MKEDMLKQRDLFNQEIKQKIGLLTKVADQI